MFINLYKKIKEFHCIIFKYEYFLLCKLQIISAKS
jgi:hypothetical protein